MFFEGFSWRVMKLFLAQTICNLPGQEEVLVYTKIAITTGCHIHDKLSRERLACSVCDGVFIGGHSDLEWIDGH